MILVIVAHPDDESFFMGGTIAKLRHAGERVRVVTLADGVGSRFRWYQWYERRLARAERAEAFGWACKALDIEGQMLRVFPDQRADAIDQLDLNRAVERVMADVKPYVVYTHWKGDLNLDHRRVAEAVIVATRPGKAKYVRQVYSIQPEYPELAILPWVPTYHAINNELHQMRKLMACGSYVREIRDETRSRAATSAIEQFMEIR